MNKPAKAVYHVLIADDSEADRSLMKIALRQASCLQVIAEVSDGTDVITYLRGQAEFSDRQKFPLPDLLLLDLKMPVLDGFEVLEWLNKQPCPGLTVVVLTDSMQAEHIKRALDLGADLFQVKPRANHDRAAMILALEDYVLRASTATPRHASFRPTQSFA
ncbi:MAG: two-component system response regulator [Pedosphaera sp.]|nr:two-component system response regulator [Pedosphaera sp.]